MNDTKPARTDFVFAISRWVSATEIERSRIDAVAYYKERMATEFVESIRRYVYNRIQVEDVNGHGGFEGKELKIKLCILSMAELQEIERRAYKAGREAGEKRGGQ